MKEGKIYKIIKKKKIVKIIKKKKENENRLNKTNFNENRLNETSNNSILNNPNIYNKSNNIKTYTESNNLNYKNIYIQNNDLNNTNIYNQTDNMVIANSNNTFNNDKDQKIEGNIKSKNQIRPKNVLIQKDNSNESNQVNLDKSKTFSKNIIFKTEDSYRIKNLKSKFSIYNKNEIKDKNFYEQISNYAKEIIIDIADSFNSILSFNSDFINKFESLAAIRLETFSCYNYFYENMFRYLSSDLNRIKLKALRKIGLDLYYKILLILKESCFDQIKNVLKSIEYNIKEANNFDNDRLTLHMDNIGKTEFFKIIEINDNFINTLLDFHKVEEENNNSYNKSNKDHKENKVLNKPNIENKIHEGFTGGNSNKNNLGPTKKFIIENRKDFLLFCLNGKLINESNIDLTRILSLSFSKENIRVSIKNIVFPLLDEKHGTNKIMKAVFKFLKEEKNNSFNYDLMVQKNFNKNMYSENYLKKLDINKPFCDNNVNDLNEHEISDKSLNSFRKDLLDSSDEEKLENRNLSPYDYNYNITNPNEKKTRYEIKNTKKHKISNKCINLKSISLEINKKFNTKIDIENALRDDDLKKENNDIKNLFSSNFAYVFLKYYSNYNSIYTKVMISSKCLFLLTKNNSNIRKNLVERGIFNVIFFHFQSFSKEKILISTLKLMRNFLDYNSITVITLKNF